MHFSVHFRKKATQNTKLDKWKAGLQSYNFLKTRNGL